MGKVKNRQVPPFPKRAGAVCFLFLLGLCIILLKQCRGGVYIKEFTAFVAVPGEAIEKNNRLQQVIGEKIGARAEVSYLTGQTAEEKIGSMIDKGEYPDFIHGAGASSMLVEAGALIPLEGYLEDYPNLKAYLTKNQWDSLRQADGHIYFIPCFDVIYGKNMSVYNSGEAFWIQKRVLEWAGYPNLHTLDEYFDLISRYLKENPDTEGQENIGFEILCDDWRYFCLENPPMFLAGYPNDGCAIVDKETGKAKVYDTLPEAKQYFGKLCEMYHQGVIDPETFTLSYNQYLERLGTGRVLGMVDQYWEIMSVQNSLYAEGKEECTYVPFPITASEDIEPDYNRSAISLNTGEGIGISVSCADVEGALKFFNDLLSPEVMKLRLWGEEGKDYLVDKNEVFYRTSKMREDAGNDDYRKSNFCQYVYFPCYEGMLADGINACKPMEQPGEYQASLSEYDNKVLEAYGHRTWSEFMGPEKKGEPWFPLYSCLSLWEEDTDYGRAKKNMERLKRQWLPRVIMSPEEDFENTWKEYQDAYLREVDVEAYEEELNREIARRVKREGS